MQPFNDLSILDVPAQSPMSLEPPREPVHLYEAFPTLIDNTMREQFFTCPTKFFRSSIQKLSPLHTSEHLHFGGAFATGLEVLRKSFFDSGLSQEASLFAGIEAATLYYGAFQPPEKSLKTYERLVGGLIAYADRYPLATDHIQPARAPDGKARVEFTFALPIPGTAHPVTGEPILYGGRFDMVGLFNGTLFGLDDKTTSRLGPSWNRQWALNSQITGYCWAARELGLNLSGMVMRGQSILANGYEFAEVIEYRPEWKIDRWLAQLQRDVTRMCEAYRTFTYDMALGSACTAYSGCPFVRLCTSPNPLSWVQSDYKNHIWNPLAKDPEQETK